MKRTMLLVWTILLLAMLSACRDTSYEIQIHQAEEQIIQIVMFDNTGANKGMPPIELIVIEEKDKIAEFLDDLQKVPCGQLHNDPATSYGYLYVEIIYKNGDVEIIGTDMLSYRSADGDVVDVYDGWCYADFDSMCMLYEQYTGTAPSVVNGS